MCCINQGPASRVIIILNGTKSNHILIEALNPGQSTILLVERTTFPPTTDLFDSTMHAIVCSCNYVIVPCFLGTGTEVQKNQSGAFI